MRMGMGMRMEMEMPSGAKLAPNSHKLDPSLEWGSEEINYMHTISMLLALKFTWLTC